MKNFFIVSLFLIIIPIISFSQRSRNKGKIIKATTGIQFSYAETEFLFKSYSWITDSRDLDLSFLTPRSGTFEIFEGDSFLYTYKGQFKLPPVHVGIGLGFQIINEKDNFHEISLTRLSFNTSTSRATIVINDGNREDNIFLGTKESSFSIGLRYQIGRYFGEPSLMTRFGIAVVLDPVYSQHKTEHYTSNIFPINSKMLNFHIGISPMLNFKFSDNVSLTTKLFPQIRFAAIGSVRERNPFIPPTEQLASNESGFRYFSLTGALTLEYVIKDRKRRRR